MGQPHVLRLRGVVLDTATVICFDPVWYTLSPMEAVQPLAYLITFRSYGTWLHGDQRGSVDRFHNHCGEPFLPRNDDWLRQDARLLKQPAVTLNPDQRLTVEHAIRETCEMRNWFLRAFNVRTNHVHIVVSNRIKAAGAGPERL